MSRHTLASEIVLGDKILNTLAYQVLCIGGSESRTQSEEASLYVLPVQSTIVGGFDYARYVLHEGAGAFQHRITEMVEGQDVVSDF